MKKTAFIACSILTVTLSLIEVCGVRAQGTLTADAGFKKPAISGPVAASANSKANGTATSSSKTPINSPTTQGSGNTAQLEKVTGTAFANQMNLGGQGGLGVKLIPEPSTLAIMGFGLATLIAIRLKKS